MTECRFCGAPCYVCQVPVSIPYSDAYCEKPECVQKMRHLCLPSLLVRYQGSLAIQKYVYEQNPTRGEASMMWIMENEITKIRQEMNDNHLVETDPVLAARIIRDSVEQYKRWYKETD